ncbi:MAG: hypothetical protein ABIN37_05595 [Burkholderiaceae bacterium]
MTKIQPASAHIVAPRPWPNQTGDHAGETASELAADYDLSEQEIEEAVLYERAA